MKWTWADVQALPVPVYYELIDWLRDEQAGGQGIDLSELE